MEPVPLISLLGLGFLSGLKHALDADHIVALSTITSETKSLKKSSIAGVFWGMGHSDSSSHNHIHKSFLMGAIQGLAGSAALTLLILASIHSIFQGLLYILVFGVE